MKHTPQAIRDLAKSVEPERPQLAMIFHQIANEVEALIAQKTKTVHFVRPHFSGGSMIHTMNAELEKAVTDELINRGWTPPWRTTQPKAAAACVVVHDDFTPEFLAKLKAFKKADPKATAATGKTHLDLIPPAASKACADALNFGAFHAGKDGKGYGPWNWRLSEGVKLSTYVAAAKRHLDDLMEGEDCAPDSGVHHAGHIMAGMAIVLDAMKHGKLIDDRVLVKKQ